MDAIAGTALTPPERLLWASIKDSEWLEGKTVADFLDLDSRDDRRDLLYRASRIDGGARTMEREDAQVLAATLYARLRRGVLPWSEGAPLFVERGLSEPFQAALPPPPVLLPRSRAVVCLRLWPRALTWAAPLPLLPLPPVRCAVHEFT